MSTNSSSSSSITMYSLMLTCISSTPGLLSMTSFTVANILIVLPLCSVVLYLGVQRWRQQRPGAVMSHCDLFTYHMVATELLNIFGFVLLCFGVHTDQQNLFLVGISLSGVNLNGQMCFHVLTCMERYLAVVHPITYRSLREARGIRIRNMTICCVWLFCLIMTGCLFLEAESVVSIIAYGITAVTLSVTFFCSFSVLCVLIRPGPGDGGGGRQQVDQSKLRAYYTIMAILGMLMVRFTAAIFSIALSYSMHLGEAGRCGAILFPVWFGLPSSLILPLLFLQRAGKLLCCKNNESGQGSG